jgi:hypothetical protein
MARMRYEFDPMGVSHSYVGDWEREMKAASVRKVVAQAAKERKAREAADLAPRLSIWVRLSQLTHARPAGLRTAH